MTIEKYFDLTEIGADYEIKKYLANSWYIDYTGLTYCILKKVID